MKTACSFTVGAFLALFGLLAAGCTCQGIGNCTAANCNGCCSASGVCQQGGSAGACGSKGGVCFQCSSSQSCVGGACLFGNPDGGGGGCGASCQGCCAPNGFCITPANTVDACGSGGAACAICATGQSCTGGVCMGTTNCTGCIDPGTGSCLPGDGPTACGTGGVACVSCANGDQCNGGQCVAACNGCMNGSGCQVGNTTAACGTGGGACATCTGTMTCTNGQCVTPGCNGCVDGTGTCQVGTSNSACGKGGGNCASCTSPATCTQGVCVNMTPLDGGIPACTTSATYASCSGCGTERWSVKVCTDSACSQVSKNPQLSTIPTLLQFPTNSNSSAPRGGGSGTWTPEYQTYLLRDVTIKEAKPESDSDYHIVIADPGSGVTMVSEVPCPNCASGSPFQCNYTHARAAVEKQFGAPLGNVSPTGVVATIVGIGFYDPPHGQTGAAPNNLEIHSIIAICFGKGCDPFGN